MSDQSGGFFTHCANCGQRVTPEGCGRCATCKNCTVGACPDEACPGPARTLTPKQAEAGRIIARRKAAGR